MAKNIGSPANLAVQKRRETFRIEIEVGGTDAVPAYTLRFHGVYVQRDAAGNEVGRGAGYVTATVDDASIPAGLRNGIANLVARADAANLPTDV
jgi:hypothetical protein